MPPSQRPSDATRHRPAFRWALASESDGGHLPVASVRAGALHGAHVVTRHASAQVKSYSCSPACGHRNDERDRGRQEPRSPELLLPAFGVDVDVDGLPLPSRTGTHARMDTPKVADPSSAAFVASPRRFASVRTSFWNGCAQSDAYEGAFEVLSSHGEHVLTS